MLIVRFLFTYVWEEVHSIPYHPWYVCIVKHSFSFRIKSSTCGNIQVRMNPSWEAGVLGLQVKVGTHNCLVEIFRFLEYMYIYLSIYLDPPRVSNVQPARSVFMLFRGTNFIPLKDSGNIYKYIYIYFNYIHIYTYLLTYTFFYIHISLYTYMSIYIYHIYIYICTLKLISHGSTPAFFQWLP